jgi:galactose mutarotase-like enzyme
MQTIQNKHIIVKAQKAGAELTSIVKEGVEYLWQADPAVWGKHSPILFPIVGTLVNNSYQIEDTTYQLPKHGFARDLDFELRSQSNNTLHYQLNYTEELLKIYPYKFELHILYSIENENLEVSYLVKNIDEKEIVFSIGGHPAFKCPLFENEQFEDYQLTFEQEEILLSHLVDLSNGTITASQAEIAMHDKSIPLNTSLFDRDALIFRHLKSKWVALLHKETGKGVKMSINEFPALGIWSKTGCEQFVCLEPWQGLADNTGFNGQFTEKEDIVVLNPNESWKASYTIQII